jgi:hypothetical protein
MSSNTKLATWICIDDKARFHRLALRIDALTLIPFCVKLRDHVKALIKANLWQVARGVRPGVVEAVGNGPH